MGKVEEIKDNKMGIMPVNKLLVTMSLPIIASMLMQACYNVVDSIFVSRIVDETSAGSAGTDALTAVGYVFPFQTLMIAFSTGMGVGMNALLSRALGEKDDVLVNRAARNGIFLAICNTVFFMILGIFFARTLILSQDGEGLALEYGVQYLRIVFIGSAGCCLQITMERLLQATGRTLLSMAVQMTGAIINIILDPILIFGYFGFPEMKVAGAAVATITGQLVGVVLGIILNLKYNKEIRLSFRGFKPEWEIIKKIYSVGLPSIIMQSIGSVMTFFMNKILTSLDVNSVAVFSVYFKLQSFFFMPLFGLNNGMIPIVAFNYGARKRTRMVKTIKLSMVYAFVVMLLGFIAFEIFPDKLLLLFDTKDESLLRLGVPALKIIAVHFLLAWFCIIALSAFQALGNGIYSLIVSAARQLVVLLPVAFILSKIGGLDAVWWSFPVAELMSVICSAFFLFRINKNIISKV
ncbi:MAG: MATE family efflux transporter [Lachnospiraceae bacterium]|nr:MATE family efflux transporter [Lachnospiraceae bacterium]